MKKIILTLLIFCSLVSYSQVKISDMTTTTNPVAAYLPVVRGGSNFKLSTDSLMYRKVDSVKVSNDTVYYYKYAGQRFVAGVINGTDQSLIDSVRASLYGFTYTSNNDGTITQRFTDWNGTLRLNTVLSGGGVVSPANGDLIKFNSTSDNWENFAPSYLSSVDTSNITNFSVKVRSLFSATSPVTYSNGVFGLTNTDGITEGSTNKFYTDLRARAAISLTTTGTSGAATYNNSTGVINVPNYGSATIDTSNIANFSVKVRSLFSATSPVVYNNGVFSINNSVADGSTKGAASFTANDFNSSSGNISIDYTNAQAATSSVKGLLTNTDWNTFNSKKDLESFITLTSSYTGATQTALQKMFNSTTNGAFTASDNTTYLFECGFNISGMSASSGMFNFGILGTATISSINYISSATKGVTLVAIGSTASATGLTTNTTTTTGGAMISGKIIITTGGTIIPAFGLSVSAGATIGSGSWFRIWPIGTNTVTSYGNWN